MSLKSRVVRLEKTVNAATDAEPASMGDDPRFIAALCGALPEKELEAFAARWPEFARLCEPPDPNEVDPVEAAIRAVEDEGKARPAGLQD
jgi:hypothetical protein